MHLKKWSKWVVISGTLLIWLIKLVIRPYVHIPAVLKPLVGISPNLIGCFVLPFAACWFFQKYFLFRSIQHLRIACWFGLVLVIINEYLQLIPIFGRTFDYLDILFSFIGIFFGYVAFARLMVKAGIATKHEGRQLV